MLGIFTINVSKRSPINCSYSAFERFNDFVISIFKGYLLLSSTTFKRSSSVIIWRKYSISSWIGKLFGGGISENGMFFTFIFSGSTSTYCTLCSFWFCCALLVLSSSESEDDSSLLSELLFSESLESHDLVVGNHCLNHHLDSKYTW